MKIEFRTITETQKLDSNNLETEVEMITLLPGQSVTINFNLDNSIQILHSSEANEPDSPTFHHSKFTKDSGLMTVVGESGDPVRLTPIENKLLDVLAENINHVVMRRKLKTTLFPDKAFEVSDKDLAEILKVHIARLRRKLPESGNAFSRGRDDHHIVNVRGVGYMLYDPATRGIVEKLENYFK